MDEYVSNNEGYIPIQQTLVDGAYTLTMISVPTGYTIDSIPKTIQVLNGQTTEIAWQLYGQAGQIQIHLTSSAYSSLLDRPTGANLQGAEFEVYNPFTYTTVASIKTDANGVAATAGLPIGRYIIREKTPAAYYAKSGKEVEVYIRTNNDVVRVEFQQAPIALQVANTVTGNANISAGTFGKFIFKNVDNTSGDRLDNFFWTIKIPTDAVRGGTLFTGKWSGSVNYTIKYKTNMNDFRVLATGLNSSTTYQYDLSSLAINTQGGEYVTEIRFEFGTVPASFKVVTQPIFYGYVLPNVVNGYKIILRSECGGKYKDAWKTASALWTTNVINTGNTQNVQYPSTLPKTGY